MIIVRHIIMNLHCYIPIELSLIIAKYLKLFVKYILLKTFRNNIYDDNIELIRDIKCIVDKEILLKEMVKKFYNDNYCRFPECFQYALNLNDIEYIINLLIEHYCPRKCFYYFTKFLLDYEDENGNKLNIYYIRTLYKKLIDFKYNCHICYLNTIKLLFNYKDSNGNYLNIADITYSSSEVLRLSLLLNDLEFLKFLLNYTDQDENKLLVKNFTFYEYNALSIAIKLNNLDIIKLFLNYRDRLGNQLDINDIRKILNKIVDKDFNIIKYIFEYKDQFEDKLNVNDILYILGSIINKQDLDVIKYVFEYEDLDGNRLRIKKIRKQYENNILIIPLKNNKLDIFKYLLNYEDQNGDKFDINDIRNSNKNYILALPIKNGKLNILKFLLNYKDQKGNQLNIADIRKTLCNFKVLTKKFKSTYSICIKFLLEYQDYNGDKLIIDDINNEAILKIILKYRCLDVFKLLLEYKDQYGKQLNIANIKKYEKKIFKCLSELSNINNTEYFANYKDQNGDGFDAEIIKECYKNLC